MNFTAPPLSNDYLNEYGGRKLVVVASLFISLEAIFIALRLYARSLGETRKGLDDILVLPAFFACLVLNALGLVMVQYCGVGRHATALAFLGESYKLTRWGKGIIAMVPLYLLAVTLPKICVLVLYLRIFTQWVYRTTCYVLIAIVMGNFIGGTIALLTSCIPLAKIWDSELSGHCINNNAFYQWISFPNILTDVAILILPLPLVWNLHATINQKVGLTITFSAGGVGLIISIIRFINFFARDAFEDPTMTAVDLMAWTVIEPGMYLIAACLVTLRPLGQMLMGKNKLRNFKGTNSRGYQLSSLTNDNNGAPGQPNPGVSVATFMPLKTHREQDPIFGDDRRQVQEDVYIGRTGTKSNCISSPQRTHGFQNHQILVEQDYSVTVSTT